MKDPNHGQWAPRGSEAAGQWARDRSRRSRRCSAAQPSRRSASALDRDRVRPQPAGVARAHMRRMRDRGGDLGDFGAGMRVELMDSSPEVSSSASA
eukprot:scaffold63365_cov71-Phaeocystis_antarctica.AAC.2